MKKLAIILVVIGFASLGLTGCQSAPEGTLNYTDERVTLSTTGGRDIPLRLLTPDGCNKCALIIFSPGANATYDRYNKLLLPLAQAGYRIAIPNHTDSEDHPNRGDYKPQDWMPTRLEDYAEIASTYETDYLIAAGHSFGGLIAQIAGGAQTVNASKLDPPRPRVVLAYSPPGPVPNYLAPESWNTLSVPTLVTTGTTDIVPLMAEQWEMHLVSYEETPRDMAYALIYEKMDHYMNGAFGRETDDNTVERDRAVEHLIQSSLFFVNSVKNGKPPSTAQWDKREQNFVEARANHE